MKSRNAGLRNVMAIAALGLPLAVAGIPAHADDDMNEASAIARMANLIPPERAIEIANSQKPGVVTDFDLDHKRKGWVYEIEIVDAQGTEWEVELEAVTGKVLRVKRDWF
jgi:uncharacterized membrane protein YkoI